MRRLAEHRVARVALVNLSMLVAAAIVYGGAVVASRELLHDSGHPALWILLLASVVAAGVLTRLRPRVERLVNWLAFGEQADGYEMINAFVGRMASTLDVEEILPRIAETAARSVRGTRSEVRLWLADGGEWRQAWSSAPEAPTGSGAELTVRVAHQGSAVGEIGVDARSGLSASDQQVLDELARPAGVALSTVRLTVELRRRIEETTALVAELESSRRRLVESRRREQERIRSEVDGAVRPHLSAADAAIASVSAMLDAAALDAALLHDAVPESNGLGGAVAQLELARSHGLAALEELRTLARGVFPAVLADAGVEAALRAWAERQAPPVAVRAVGDLEPVRAHPAAEAALYGACVSLVAEAVPTDQERPSGVARVELTARDTDVCATILLPGEVRFGPESVQSANDRIGALGGSLDIESSDAGSELVLTLPLGDDDPVPRSLAVSDANLSDHYSPGLPTSAPQATGYDALAPP